MKRLTQVLLAVALIATCTTSIADEANSGKTAAPTNEVRQQYDFIIGEWECTFVQFAKGKEATNYPCTWHGRYTFDGLMVQDDFRMYHQEKMVFSGTTLRTWVAHKKRWDLAFLGAGVGHWPNFFGEWQEGQMQITSKGTDQLGEFDAKIRFTNIQDDSFLWQMEKSYDGGENWQLDAEIRSRRNNG